MADQQQYALRVEREQRLSMPGAETDPGAPTLIRPEIENSWSRCEASGVSIVNPEMPYTDDFDPNSFLHRAAGPVLSRIAEQLADAPVTILMADSAARIVDRRAGTFSLLSRLDRAHVGPGFWYDEDHTGTNGIGTALAERQLFEVRGSEHYKESLQGLVCVGMPISHPITGDTLGVLDLTCRVPDRDPEMASLVEAGVREIRGQLFAEASHAHQTVYREFLLQSRRTRYGLVALAPGVKLSNAAASALLADSDYALLQEWACDALATAEETDGLVRVANQANIRARACRVPGVQTGTAFTIELRPTYRPPLLSAVPSESA